MPEPTPTLRSQLKRVLAALDQSVFRMEDGTRWCRDEIDKLLAEDGLVAQADELIRLADELTDAVDAEGEDIGGYRDSLTILREIGPLLDRMQSRRIVGEHADRLAHAEADTARLKHVLSCGALKSTNVFGIGPGGWQSPDLDEARARIDVSMRAGRPDDAARAAADGDET